ncbi:MAG: hypothetical protein QOJ79_1893 [Actinomycetota bacterium]|jgi:hypothetical protein|nr:hypothetical protein [Actinomycetota bacterium]
MRPPRLLLHRLAPAALVVGLVVPTGNVAHGATCAVDLEQRNAWSQVSGGPGAVAMADADPCHLVAVRPDRTVQSSSDGGETWSDVGTAPQPARRLFAAGLGEDLALAPVGEGLFVSKDRGRSWQAASGLSGSVLDVMPDEGDSSTVYAVVRPGTPASLPAALPTTVAAGTPVYVSHDGAGSFKAVAATSGLSVSAVAPDPGTPGRVWLGVDGAAGGLFLSTDSGSSFLRKAGGDVRALGVSRLAGGGSEVVAATSAGFLLSRDGGNTVSTKSPNVGATALALEWNHPSAFMALSDGRAIRSSTTGTSVRDQSSQLPTNCGATALARDRSIPSVFLVACADGQAWRYRSDGTDLSAADSPDSTTTLVPGTTLGPATPMRVLSKLKITQRGRGQDGSIAFDGTILYYADMSGPGVVHRQIARTGKDIGDLHTRVPRGILQLAYDANRHHLFVVDRHFNVWDVRLSDGSATMLFNSPADTATSGDENDDNDEENANRPFPGAFTYDPATDRFLFASDGADGWDEYDRSGHKTYSCVSNNLPTVVTVSGGTGDASVAGLVATGDGEVYVEAEDDSTVLRMDRSCHVLAQFSHEYFSEAYNENDSLACDTTSFPVAAVWMRDAGAGFMAAYEVPGGYCALPSTVTVTSPPGVAAGQRGPVCATLRLRSTGAPLSGLPVDLLVAGRGIASPVSDASGRACADYVPLAREAGAGQGPGTHSARQPVLAAFLGTAAYRPSSARRSVLVSSEIPPLPLPPRPITPPVAAVHPAAPLVVVPVVPPAQPPPPPPNVPQSQPIAQGHPGAQPGAQGAPGGAMAPEDEEEVATQSADVAEFRAQEDPSMLWPAAAVPLAAGLLLGVAVARRRRVSQVRGQWA